ncbi:MAG: hypothetical protein ACOC0Y_01380 [Spirochaetota bacterium]
MVRVLVESQRGAETTVRIGGRVLPARIDASVRPGVWYRAEVVGSDRHLVLRTLGTTTAPVDVSSLARESGLPAATGSSIVDAFIRSGLALRPERLQLALRRAVSEYPPGTKRLSLAERARLAAVLEAKGLLDSDAVWVRAVAAVGGSGEEDLGSDAGSSGDAGERGPTSEQNRENEADEGREREESDRNSGHEAEPDGAEETAAAVEADVVVDARTIRRAFTAVRSADDPLQLLNHRQGGDDHWVIVPLEFAGVSGFHASVKIRFSQGDLSDRPAGPRARERAPGYREAIVDVRSEDKRWTFAIEPAGGTVRVTALAGSAEADGEEAAHAFSDLESRLARLGIAFHHALMSKDSNDGFSSRDELDILRHVDSRV